jgi:tetratricopeptide (TPR) repeat protein
MLGDVLTELGRHHEALRVYSAVTELLAEDPSAQRSLASVLKQQGRLSEARDRLARAVELRPDDARLRLELADVQLRSGEGDAAMKLLEELVAGGELSRELLHPTKSRLGQLYATRRRAARKAGDERGSKAWDAKLVGLELAGGVENDIKVYLSWDTDGSDVDLWVTTPGGEKIYYSHKKGEHGEALYHDITTGYGPESMTVPQARSGQYKIEVNYFSSNRSGLTEARGEVTVILNEGSDREEVHRLPYRLHKPKQTLHVANVEVPA